MVRMFVRHAVRDFAHWKRAYDAFDRERKKMGVKGHAVFRSVADPHMVTLWHDYDDLAAAKAFVESDRLREVMEEAGVLEEPTVWFATPA